MSARERPRRVAPQSPEPAGFGSRRAAFEAVASVLGGGSSAEDALARGRDPDPLARAIAVTTFRRLGTLGRVLEARLARGLSADERAFALLATGAAQILYLSVPDHAAVDLAVEVARRDKRLAHLAGLANAVLRRVARERDAILADAVPPLEDAPRWLADRWEHHYGSSVAEGIASAHRAGAAVDVTVKSDGAGWAARLGGTLLPTGSVRLPERLAVEDADGFGAGEWWVQDAAAAIPARLLAPAAGSRVLDLCAAPGGKTAQLAAAGANVVALDRSEPRLRRLRANMDRLRMTVDAVCADALSYTSDAPFDAVLVDAPCTATGTLRRHPDVAWGKTAKDLESLTALQGRLLDRAADLCRPGGRLVYCVCSLEPEEGEMQAEAFLRRRPDFHREAVGIEETGLGAAAVTPSGDLRTRPDMLDGAGTRGGLDGFFALRASRTGP